MKFPFENPLASSKKVKALEAELTEQKTAMAKLTEKPKERLIAFGLVDEKQSYLVASSDQNSDALADSATVHGMLVSGKLISESMNAIVVNPLQLARLGNVPKDGVVTPPDFGDYQDYWDSFLYVPKINRSIMLKHSMIWQTGYDIKAKTPEQAKKIKLYLEENVDPWVIDGSLYALIFGNMYWHFQNTSNEKSEDKKEKDAAAKDLVVDPLDPATVGVKPKDKKNPRKGVETYVTFMGLNELDKYPVAEILHLKINAEPWAFFGFGSIRCVLPTTKAILYMEKKLPWLARRLAHPLLLIDLIDPETGKVSEASFKKMKALLETRPDGADIYNDGSISKIEEVYKNVGQSRQMVQPLLEYFGKNETTGLGIPEIAHGSGSTTLKGTAAEQDKILDSEIKWYQYWLKRFYEQKIFPLIELAPDTHLNWRPLREEDKVAISSKICGEVDRGILSPAYASQIMGYPAEALNGAIRLGTLVPVDSPAAQGQGSAAVKVQTSTGETFVVSQQPIEPKEKR